MALSATRPVDPTPHHTRHRALPAPGLPSRFTVYRTVLPEVVTRTPVVGVFGSRRPARAGWVAVTHKCSGKDHGDDAAAHVLFPSTVLVRSVRVTTQRPSILTRSTMRSSTSGSVDPLTTSFVARFRSTPPT